MGARTMNEKKVISIEIDDLKRIYNYALSHCREVCPEKRDPDTCIVIVEIGKLLGISPPCVEDYGGFSEKTFKELIKEIENRRGKTIDQVLEEIRDKGYRSLQDQIDEMDGQFALDVLKAYEKRKRKEEKGE